MDYIVTFNFSCSSMKRKRKWSADNESILRRDHSYDGWIAATVCRSGQAILIDTWPMVNCVGHRHTDLSSGVASVN